MLLATKTMAAINAALEADQGAKFRGLLGELMPLAGDAYSTKDEDFRSHLGASIIGRECAREVWYSFRWTTRKRFEGRMVRLFNRGHLEEPRFVALLKMIGCQVWQVDVQGKQFRVGGYRNHSGGSMDGVALGIPDLPDEPVLAEFKTHSEKSFIKVSTDGCMSAKWEHFIQQQIYMGKNNLKWSLYCAVNKNNDEIHMELVQFDPIIFAKYEERAAVIIEARTPPAKINKSPGFFKCKFCDQHPVCHGKTLPAVTCRSCVHSQVGDDGWWFCTEPRADAAFGDNVPLTSDDQRRACENYELDLVFKGE